MEEWDIDIVFAPAMLGLVRKSDEIATTNNLSRWWKQSKTRIKNKFQEDLKEWFIPEYDDNPYRWAEIHFTILRTNHMKIDSDYLGPSSYKWAIDLLTVQGYIIDDDQCRVVQHPTKLGVEGAIETSIRMQVKLNERFEMTLEDLKEKSETLAEEMNVFFSGKRTKAGSARIRSILGDVKNATPQLRRDLVAADKK